jgi:ATP-dependent Clp protease, protease subunit
MAKEILLYTSIHEWSSADFIKAVDEVGKSEDIVVRVNTNGGSPEYGFGMIAKLQEHEGDITIKVDGKAYSMGLFMLAYADKVEALDVSEFMIHRASYPEWFETSSYFTDDKKANLKRINASLRKAVENKIDVELFEKVAGITMDDLFAETSRTDIFLTAQQAKRIGLIDKINKITPQKAAEINDATASIAAKYGSIEPIVVEAPNPVEKPKTNKKMTIEELKEKHPAVYASVFNSGKEAGVSAERDRVGAWMTYVDVDAKVVGEGINEGKELTTKIMADLSRKAFSKEALGAIAADSPAPGATATPEQPAPAAAPTSEKPEVEAFLKNVVEAAKLN